MIVRTPDDRAPLQDPACGLSEKPGRVRCPARREASMRLLTSIIGGSLAAAAVGGAFAVPALASPHPAAHTLRYISVSKAGIGFSDTSAGVQQTDVSKAGKVVGFDEVYGVNISASAVANDLTLDTKGGLLYGTYTLNL